MNEEIIESARQFIRSSSNQTKIYIGSDSRRRKNYSTGKYVITYTVSIVCHLNGKNGCKVFAAMDTETDYSGVMQLRLMNEVYRATEAFLALKDDLEGKEVEIHLDLNPKREHKSSVVVNDAVGYVLGMTGIKPKLKPQAFAASTCSDLWQLKMA